MDTEERLKVLVIHHDLGACCAYMAIARSAGWEPSACEDQGDVAGALRRDDFDVLIFDFSPESGFLGLRKARDVAPTLPAILITSHPVDHHEAMSLGVKLILPKPPDPAKLRESLAALVNELPASDFKVLFEFLERCDASPFRNR
jgi:DNA-binding response OmpR family regulator